MAVRRQDDPQDFLRTAQRSTRSMGAICLSIGLAPWLFPLILSVLSRSGLGFILAPLTLLYYPIAGMPLSLFPLRFLFRTSGDGLVFSQLLAMAVGVSYIVLAAIIPRWRRGLTVAIILACAQAVFCFSPLVKYSAAILGSQEGIILLLWLVLIIRLIVQLGRAMRAAEPASTVTSGSATA